MAEWRRLTFALAALTAVMVAGTVGYLLLGFGLLDALYQTVTTVTTVGFREVQPLSGGGKIFTIALIVVGVGTALYSQKCSGGAAWSARSPACVTTSWSAVGDAWDAPSRATSPPWAGEPVVIDKDPIRIENLPYPAVLGDATDDDVLVRAGVRRARAIVAALDTDAGNLFVTLSARALRSELFIVARVRLEENEDKLRRAGADRVVNPQSIGGARMAAFVLQPHVTEFVDVVMHDRDIEFRLEEMPVRKGSPIEGCSIREAHVRDRTGALVLALRDRNGTFTTNPPPETVVQADQVIIAIGTSGDLEKLQRLVTGATPRVAP